MSSRFLGRGPVEQRRIHTAADRELLERVHLKRKYLRGESISAEGRETIPLGEVNPWESEGSKF